MMTFDDIDKGWEKFWPDFKIGKISEKDFWTGILHTAGAKNIDVYKAKIIYRETQNQIENMLGLVKKLKPNYGLSVLANISKEWLGFKIKKFN